MDVSRNLTSNAVGLCLLPSELIQDILFRLTLPEIVRLKSVSKTLTSVISCDDFRRDYNIQSSSDTWLFIYKKRSPRDSVLHGFTDRSNRWFKIPVADYLSPVVPPGEDLYFLTASGDFFLFASNNCREVIAVNLTLNTVKKIPPSPLGPRGTSSWRRSGLKLIAGPPGSDRFRFLFAELYENRPVLFEYISEIDTWRSVEARENEWNQQHGGQREKEKVYLSVIHRRSESVVLATGPGNDAPVILRPRFEGGGVEERLAIGFSTGDVSNRLHVYGDGCMVIVRSEGVDLSVRVRFFTCIEVWGLSVDGRQWEFMSRVPEVLVERVRKPYNAMMGCLEERDGIIRVILVSNFEGLWDLIWLSYDLERRLWNWVPLPATSMKGLNMAGITLSTGLTL
ncbi:F-box domain [Macleaya cordata]|uniref:F-box domain n=1 Tax=Macleaya cordata TaxID=56857 RepID=A0A200Q844_MACCD|nr:F-box domain [Macleaya cordata]